MTDAGCRMQKNQDQRTKIQIKKRNKKSKQEQEEEGGNVSYTVPQLNRRVFPIRIYSRSSFAFRFASIRVQKITPT